MRCQELQFQVTQAPVGLPGGMHRVRSCVTQIAGLGAGPGFRGRRSCHSAQKIRWSEKWGYTIWLFNIAMENHHAINR